VALFVAGSFELCTLFVADAVLTNWIIFQKSMSMP
jgi:hypothetical protein